MQIILYFDVIFLMNFIAEYVVLFITSKMCSQNVKKRRLILGALLETILFLLLFVFPIGKKRLFGVLYLVGSSMGIIALTFGKKALIKKWFCSTTILFLLGSLMNYLRMQNGQTVYGLCKWMLIFWGASIIVMGMVCFLKQRKTFFSQLYTVVIKHRKREAKFLVYVDTGNFLKDPFLGRPVALVSEKIAFHCMTPKLRQVYENYKETGRLNYCQLPLEDGKTTELFFEITYQSVGNASGKLFCFLVDCMQIVEQEKRMKKQPIAIAPSYVFEGKEYQGLLYAECLE